MTPRIKVLFTTAVLVATLTTAINTATARNLSISNQNIRIAWRELGFEGGIESFCEVTLEGSFHYRTMVKPVGSLIGFITRAELNRCSEPTRTSLDLPWHIRYRSFRGTLPDITAVRFDLIDWSLLINLFGFIGCLFRSTVAQPMLFEGIIGAGGAVTGLRVDEAASVPLFRDLGSGLCPTSITWRGTGTVTLLGTNTRITIRLI